MEDIPPKLSKTMALATLPRVARFKRLEKLEQMIPSLELSKIKLQLKDM